MPSLEDVLIAARSKLDKGEKVEAAKLIQMAAKAVAQKNMNARAAKLFEEAAEIYRQAFKPQECFEAMEDATLMLVRMGDPESQAEIVRISEKAGNIAQQASDFKKAADFYFRASDFSQAQDEKARLSNKAADSLQDLANIKEEQEDFAGAVSVIKRISGILYTLGDHELGSRMNERAAKLTMRWAEIKKREGDYLSAGTALAEAAQIKQTQGDLTEAPRLMMEAGILYEAVGLFEKAGNIYDAAHEAYRQQRLTSAYRTAMTKASEAYLKMEGKPEVLAPLLVKAGKMFTELGLGVKAKWAFKRAADMFGALSVKSREENEAESEKTYLRYQAMCLKRWGADREAEEIYQKVVDHYLGQVSADETDEAKEASAVSLEEAADVLEEAGRSKEASECLERARDLYVSLAEQKLAKSGPDEASKFYSSAADVALSLGDGAKSAALHITASEKAENAAVFYQQSDIPELATLWRRTAGLEALASGDREMVKKGIGFLRESSRGFRTIKEFGNAFDDLFTVFTTLVHQVPDSLDTQAQILVEMEEIALTTKDEKMDYVLRVLKPVLKRSHLAALMALQENEAELESKRDALRSLVAAVKK